MRNTCQPIKPKTIITAHISADLDALSSMVAAGKLYPDAVLVNPPRNEQRIGNYFTDSISYFFDFHQARDCDFSQVETLVMVDTRQRGRVSHIDPVFSNPGLTIHTYDHHPDAPDDVRADYSVVRPWGSTTAILVDILRQRGVELIPDEATMLGLGLYEDTGNFTFQSTTEHDLAAAAWLRGLGMDLDVISSLSKNKYTSTQVQILNDLLENAVTHEIKGIPIVITEARMESYVDDVSELVRTVIEMEKIQVIFALVRMGDRVQIIARSSLPGKVNAGEICAAFGGGGHSVAAAASVKDKTIAEIREELNVLLLANIHSGVLVYDKMTSKPRVLEEGQSMASAEAMMLRFNLKAAPVVAEGTMHCVGYLEYQTAAQAINHKLGNQLVAEYMNTRVQTVKTNSNLYPAMEIILSQRQRLVPVLDEAENVVGVLTRTDVVNMLLDETVRKGDDEGAASSGGHREKNVRDALKAGLPKHIYQLLELAGKIGDARRVAVYVVGGFVRDLFLRERNLDIDLTVEGDGIAFARALGEELNGRVRTHPKFQTAIVIFTNERGEEQRIDVATARQEYYERPGALPTVETSSVKMDLYRRDFTINALAVQLNRARFGVVADFFGGQRDIKEKNIRVMHSLSFIEDPTRILRAIRFERRFDFRIVAQTEKLIKNCLRLNMLESFSGARLFNELKHVFDEAYPLPCMRRMEQLGVWSAIHPLLKLTQTREELAQAVEEVLNWHRMLYSPEKPENWAVYLAALCSGLKYQEMSQVLTRFDFADKHRHAMLQQRELARKAINHLAAWKKEGGTRLSELHSLISGASLESQLFLLAGTADEDLRRDLSNYISRVRGLKLDIGGEDLIFMGISPGPSVGNILQKVLEAKIDGLVTSKEDQLEFAQSLFGDYAERPVSHEVLSGRT